ncbi:META domain-containing protein [Vibrio mediterranei]|uniref:META domain-containing protein n=1 Tax=Vibrio mediterranei TaxID=689 RepID=UPI004067AB20
MKLLRPTLAALSLIASFGLSAGGVYQGNYVITQLNEKEVPYEALKVSFLEGKLSARLCNLHGATVSFDEEAKRLKVSDHKQTLAMCDGALDNLEMQFIKILSSAPKFDYLDETGTLVIKSEQGSITLLTL